MLPGAGGRQAPGGGVPSAAPVPVPARLVAAKGGRRSGYGPASGAIGGTGLTGTIRFLPAASTAGPGGRAGAGLLACALLASLVLPASPAPASLAQDAPPSPVDLRRLAFEYKCFFGTREWKGKGEEEFLARLRAQRAAYAAAKPAELPAMEDLLARALWERSRALRAADDLRGASERAGEILRLEAGGPETARIRPEAEEMVISYSLVEADRLEKAGDDAGAKAQYANCLGTTKAEVLARVVPGMVRIALREAGHEKVRAANDLAAEGASLRAILGDLEKAFPKAVYAGPYSELKALKDRLEVIENSTGYVDVSVLDVAPALAGVKSAASPLDLATATFSFAPTTDGQPWPPGGGAAVLAAPELLLIRGVYDVRVFLPAAGKEPVAVFLRVAVAKARAAVAVPSRIPEGMVYVGPWQGGGGFFMDRTEVTIGQVKRFAAGNPKLAEVLQESNKGDGDPAWIFDPETARAWEAASGKRIPTAEQWLQAAYGPYSPQERPYPWGTEAPRAGTHFESNPRSSEPKAVGSFPAGASPYGLLDMVGNVGEWVVKDGGLWILGGHHQQDPGQILGTSGGRSWIREPAPGDAAFKALPAAAQQAYAGHRFDEKLVYCSGARMVVPVVR